MIKIRQLDHINSDDLNRLVTGYTSDAKYHVEKMESDQKITFTLTRLPLAQPYIKQFDPVDSDSLEHYQRLTQFGFAFGAYDDQECVGLALAEPREWNKSLCVWELHVARSHRRRGIGRKLIETLAQSGRAAGLRTLACETQNTNLPAVDFYRRMGMELDGIDLSYYSNHDFPDGEIALFMKKRLV